MAITLFWLRRDLRIKDNAGLYYALKNNKNVLPFFLFDRNILDQLEDKNDKRLIFIHRALAELQEELLKLSSNIIIAYGTPLEAFKDLTEKYTIKNVYTNHDYEPYATQRDQQIQDYLQSKGIPFYSYKDQCLFEKKEILTNNGTPYTVFTPYSKKWKEQIKPFYLKSYPTSKYFHHFVQHQNLSGKLPKTLFPLEKIGFKTHNISFPDKTISETLLSNYQEQRDFPARNGTSHLSVHLRFGTISIRKLARLAQDKSNTFLNELLWRDFYMMILWHFPYVEKKAFKAQYEHIQWRNKEEEFQKWCDGTTGYPIVDAGIRELNQTGYMHNRVRMITASFLTKHLLIDWRWGEAYFAQKLLDYDLAANNGGWQWAAGSGCDAAPYFRIFNPYTQAKKFDPDQEYIKKWVPEFQNKNYPKPIVEHQVARDRALKTYQYSLEKAK